MLYALITLKIPSPSTQIPPCRALLHSLSWSVAATHRQPASCHSFLHACNHRPPPLSSLTHSLTRTHSHSDVTLTQYLLLHLGVPGMVGGMLRHMKSLRSMRRDNGWIHTLLEEAENERMHLLTFLELRQPGRVFRGMVLIGQVPSVLLLHLLGLGFFFMSLSVCILLFLLFSCGY